MYSSINILWVYLVKYFWAKKLHFRWFISQNVRETARFFAVFIYFGRFWRLIWLLWAPPPPPLDQALPQPIVAHQAVLEPPMRSLALSKCRSGPSDYGWGMTQSLPLSYWSPEKSYMTSSRTATQIYIAALFRVNHNPGGYFMPLGVLYDSQATNKNHRGLSARPLPLTYSYWSPGSKISPLAAKNRRKCN